MLPKSGVQWLVVPRWLTSRIYVAGGGFGVRGRGRRAAHHISQVHHGLGKVAGEDHGLSHLLKLEEERWRARLLPASPPGAARSLGTYQLVVVDHDQLHILGLTVHCRVAPADLRGGGGHLESVPSTPGVMAKPWTDLGAWTPSRDNASPHWQGYHSAPALIGGQATPVSPPWGHRE